MDYLTADDMEKYAASQGAITPAMKMICLIPLISAAHDKKILIEDSYLEHLKKALNA